MDIPDRLPPQDLDAEQAVLGCCLLEKHAMERVAGHVVPSDFYREAHQVIYGVVLELYQEDAPVDIVTVSNGLRRRRRLEACGGGEYLTALIQCVPTTANVDRYIKILKNCAALRFGIQIGNDLQNACYAFPADPSEYVSQTMQRLEELQAMCHPNGMPQPFSATTNEDERRISRRKGRQYEYGTARFGIPELDVLTGGIEDFGYICAMALTGVGKTGLAIQCAISTAWAIKDEITGAAMLEREATDRGEKAAMQDASKLVSEAQKKLVVYFALEEGRWQLRLRMAGFCGRFDTYDCRTAEAWSKVLRDDPSLETTYQTAMTTVSKLPILITDEPQTVSSIEAHCKRIAKDSKPVLIIVDYMQQVGKDIAGTYSEEQQYRIMANTFRRLSDKLECPILGLSQVTEQGTGKARVMSAAGATAMEKSGDMNLVIERKKNDDTDEPEPFVTIRCRKAKGAPYFKPFKCYEDPKSRRWSAVRDQPDDPQPDSKKPRDRKDN